MINNEYDVIVVGAGNGGLVAAATTSKAKLKTIVFEKHNMPGGCASSFIRGRFEFEPSLHELASVGDKDNHQIVYDIFQRLGINIDWQYEKTAFRAICKGPDGYDVTVPCGRTAFIDSIEKAVPGSKQSLEDMFELIDKVNAAMGDMNNGGKINPVKLLIKHPDFVRLAGHSVNEVLSALDMPLKAQQILGTYWGYLGVPCDELNALHYLAMIDGYVSVNAAMPKNRSHQLSLALEKVITDNGGKIMYNSPVSEFLYDVTGAVYGVKVNGVEYTAKKIISNVIPNVVYNMSGDNIPKKAYKLANAKSFGISLVTAYIGLDCTAEELGVKDYTVFVYDDPDTRVQYDRRLDGSLYIVNCLNTVIPDCTPEGTSTLFFTIPVFGQDVPDSLTPQTYKRYKNELVAKYIEDYEKLMHIDIKKHIEEISIATPVTFARYLGTPEGTIYGYYCADWDSVIMRTMNVEKERYIPNLYFCGGHAEQGDGFSSAYITGENAANAVIKAIKEEN